MIQAMSPVFIHRVSRTKPNSWQFTWDELAEADTLARETPDGPHFFAALYKSRFDNQPPLSEANQISACREAAVNTYGAVEELWTKARIALVDGANTFQAAASALHDLFRGYTAAEKSAAISAAAKRRAAVLARANQVIGDNQTAAAVTGLHKNDRKLYDRNITTLNKLVRRVTRRSDDQIATGELAESAARRQSAGSTNSMLFAPLTNDDWIIDGCDAARVSFPFRFLIHAPLRAYHGLLKEWKSTADAAVVTEQIADQVFSAEYADTLRRLFKATLMAAEPEAADIEKVIEELRDALTNRRLQTVTLLGVTQAEGMIWRYADILNKSGTPIFRSLPRQPPNQGDKKYAVMWDRLNAFPEYDATTGEKVDSQELTSVYGLLSKTQMEQVFRPTAVDFVIADYTNDRNGLAHGTLIADKRLAVQAALLFGTVMQSITQYEAQGRPHRTY